MINIKNYTTAVPAARSIENIEKLLVEFGARNIMKEYGTITPIPGAVCISISFMLEMKPSGQVLPFKLPANVANVVKWLKKKKSQSSLKSIAEQSIRIAWKQQYEIIHLQLGQVEMEQLEVLEVFLPMLYDIKRNETYYQKLKSGGFKELMPSSIT